MYLSLFSSYTIYIHGISIVSSVYTVDRHSSIYGNIYLYLFEYLSIHWKAVSYIISLPSIYPSINLFIYLSIYRHRYLSMNNEYVCLERRWSFKNGSVSSCPRTSWKGSPASLVYAQGDEVSDHEIWCGDIWRGTPGDAADVSATKQPSTYWI